MKHILSFLTAILFSVAVYSCPVEDLIKSAGCPKDYPGADKLVIFDSTYSDMQESGLTYVYTHRLYKIFTAKGALDLNVIRYDYDPLSAYVEIRKVIIYRKCGDIEELDMDKVVDYPQAARAIYWGAREKMIEVGRLEPGDAVEVELFRKGFTYALLFDGEEDEQYIPPMRGHFYDIVNFYSNDPVKEKVYRVSIPADKTVQYEIYNGEVQSSAVLVDGSMIYSFAKKDITKLKREPGMVASSDVATKLLISTSPDWYAKSTWFYGVNEDFGSFESTPEVDAKVAEILEGAVSEMDSVSRLTHWCADEIRYSGISMGCGEGFTLHTGDMTFTDRCGVCKDKAGMLITMLRAAGFESYAAMTMAGSRIDYIPADQFNHSVTVVKLSDGKYHLLDPTWVPFLRELWSSAEQQQNYLMGLPEGADLGITDVSPPENHYVKIKGNAILKSDGSLVGEFTFNAEGQSDAAVRRTFTSGYRTGWDKSIETELKRLHPSAKVTGIEMDNPYDYMSGPILIKVNYEIPDFALVNGDVIIITSFVAKSPFRRAMAHLYQNTLMEERKYPFRDRCSRMLELDDVIQLPSSYRVLYKPENENFDSKTASYDGEYQLSDNGDKLIMSQTVVFNKRIYEADEWAYYKKAKESHEKFINEPVILEKKNPGR